MPLWEQYGFIVGRMESSKTKARGDKPGSFYGHAGNYDGSVPF
jgi:hypothetical protein